MFIRTRHVAVCAVLLAVVLAACRPAVKPASTVNNHSLKLSLWEMSRDASLKAEKATDKQEKAKAAQEGIAYAEECIMKTPEDAACYYYHAINTGIYYSAHVAGYQDGLRTMVRDCEKVISFNEKLDHGGAYRTLGKIYTDVPETTFSKHGVVRDIERAIDYLEKAVALDNSYPENHIYLASALIEAGRKQEAADALSSGALLIPQWKNHPDYAMWKKLNKELEDKIK